MKFVDTGVRERCVGLTKWNGWRTVAEGQRRRRKVNAICDSGFWSRNGGENSEISDNFRKTQIGASPLSPKCAWN